MITLSDFFLRVAQGLAKFCVSGGWWIGLVQRRMTEVKSSLQTPVPDTCLTTPKMDRGPILRTRPRNLLTIPGLLYCMCVCTHSCIFQQLSTFLRYETLTDLKLFHRLNLVCGNLPLLFFFSFLLLTLLARPRILDTSPCVEGLVQTLRLVGRVYSNSNLYVIRENRSRRILTAVRMNLLWPCWLIHCL